PAEMGKQDGLAVLLDDFADGGHQPLDAGGVGDPAVRDRHVEVGAQQHALIAEIEFIEGLEAVAHGPASGVRVCLRLGSRVPHPAEAGTGKISDRAITGSNDAKGRWPRKRKGTPKDAPQFQMSGPLRASCPAPRWCRPCGW